MCPSSIQLRLTDRTNCAQSNLAPLTWLNGNLLVGLVYPKRCAPTIRNRPKASQDQARSAFLRQTGNEGQNPQLVNDAFSFSSYIWNISVVYRSSGVAFRPSLAAASLEH
jgi:hypothetical protein